MADSIKAAKRDTLISAVSHDLRAPLAAVQMGASFVMQQLDGRPEHERSRKILGAVLRSCTQMDRLLRNFSDLSHIEAGDIELVLTEQDARVLCEVAGEGARELAEGRRSRIALDVPDAAVPLRVDRERMTRALAHLLENAIKHGPDGSTVTVGVRAEGEDVVFAVTDQGGGPSPETRAHLYDRTWHSTQKGRAGAGLGIAIVQGFAKLHGGEVVLATGGAPTTFTVRIRKTPAAAAAAG